MYKASPMNEYYKIKLTDEPLECKRIILDRMLANSKFALGKDSYHDDFVIVQLKNDFFPDKSVNLSPNSPEFHQFLLELLQFVENENILLKRQYLLNILKTRALNSHEVDETELFYKSFDFEDDLDFSFYLAVLQEAFDDRESLLIELEVSEELDVINIIDEMSKHPPIHNPLDYRLFENNDGENTDLNKTLSRINQDHLKDIAAYSRSNGHFQYTNSQLSAEGKTTSFSYAIQDFFSLNNICCSGRVSRSGFWKVFIPAFIIFIVIKFNLFIPMLMHFLNEQYAEAILILILKNNVNLVLQLILLFFMSAYMVRRFHDISKKGFTCFTLFVVQTFITLLVIAQNYNISLSSIISQHWTSFLIADSVSSLIFVAHLIPCCFNGFEHKNEFGENPLEEQ